MNEKSYTAPSADLIILNTTDILNTSGLSAGSGDGTALAEIGFNEFGF